MQAISVRLQALLTTIRFILILLALSCVGLEVFVRICHQGRAPLLPYYVDNGATLLPSNLDLVVSFAGLPPNRYITDAWGARIADVGQADKRQSDGIIVVGDSQALGYMLEFGQTFASELAQRLLGDPGAARILAAPASYPETFGPAILLYAPSRLEHQRVAVVVLNLGNDLDESFIDVVNSPRDRSSQLGTWLLAHSFAYEDLYLFVSHALLPIDERVGVNPILYLLNPAERVILAGEVSRVLSEVVNLIPADSKMVLIIPSDAQYDPSQLAKYERYYGNSKEFKDLVAKGAQLSRMMDAIEEYIAIRLKDEGVQVVHASNAFKREKNSGALFAATSHHITARAHELIAEQIMNVIMEKGSERVPDNR